MCWIGIPFYLVSHLPRPGEMLAVRRRNWDDNAVFNIQESGALNNIFGRVTDIQ